MSSSPLPSTAPGPRGTRTSTTGAFLSLPHAVSAYMRTQPQGRLVHTAILSKSTFRVRPPCAHWW